MGVILDKGRGLVLVDRNTVPNALGDVRISFNGSVELVGKVVYTHPVQNFSIISYDVTLLTSASNVEEVALAGCPLQPGDSVSMIGLSASGVGSANNHTVVSNVTVTKVQEFNVRRRYPPAFRLTNVDALDVDVPMLCDGAVLVDKEGRVGAFWGSSVSKEKTLQEFFFGLPVSYIRPAVALLREGQSPEQLRSLEVELWPISIAQARNQGLSEERILDIRDPKVEVLL
tara:strand:+ start:1037 stop:1723 length:687 start_codon:yes stop_codon:yes gene_type:complete